MLSLMVIMINQSTPIINHFSALIKLEDFNDDSSELENAFDNFVLLLNLHVVEKVTHKFEPIGKTFIYILSESHLAIHTWPEYKLLHLDLVTCTHVEKKSIEDAIKQSFITFRVNSFSLTKHEV
jgi:S-adenosylmethionine/arginine decarboxylase-like enzyme